ncbi:MAG: hypothetical protein R8K53_06325 [Mariprofundaceae bacterium]
MRLKTNIHIALFAFVLFAAAHASAQPLEQHKNSSIGASNDCSDISVDYVSDPNLTRQENIERMDQALFQSLSKYEGCQNASTAAGGGGGSASGGAAGGGASGGGSGSATASAEMSGTDAPSEQADAQQAATGDASDATDATDAQNMPINEDAKSGVQNTQTKGHGKVPDDIPPVDNDSILEAQIRQAAINETDPVIKAKLWNEYRKYKGLPIQKP